MPIAMNPPRTTDPTATPDQALRATVLIAAARLADQLREARPPVVICVRSAETPDPALWRASPRIPTAVDADLATQLAAPGHPTAGSRPLPRIADLQANARAWGVRAGGEVVVYDHEGGLQAARAWWVLRWAGVAGVRLLDGGYAAWVAAGLPVTSAAEVPAPGDVELSAGHMPQLEAAAAAALARTGRLLDSRIRPNYEGGPTAAAQPARGHIPGAFSVPAPANLDANGAFLDPAGLRALYAAAGADGTVPVGVYCGAGVSAAHDVLALASIGIDAPLYVGSWSAWSSDPSRPVARGPDPG